MDPTHAQLIYQQIFVGLTMLIGLMQAFYGKKYKKVTFFTIGAIACGYAVYNIVQHYGPEQWDLNQLELTITSIAASIITAVAGGALLVFVEKIGIFALGFAIGGYGIYALRLLVPAMTITVFGIPSFYMYLSIAFAGAITGFIAFKAERYIIIVSTSIGGSFLFTAGLSYFLKADLSSGSYQRYYYLAGMIVLSLLGLYVQLRYTGKSKKDEEEKKRLLEQNLLQYNTDGKTLTGYNGNYQTANNMA
jgi:hypothetical protein